MQRYSYASPVCPSRRRRLGGGPVVSPLPLKPLKLQPAKSGGGGGSEGGSVAYRAYVSSGAYTQAYRIHAGLLPKLGSLHDHLEHSGIPIDGQLGGEPCSELYSCDGLRALALQDVSASVCCRPGTPLPAGACYVRCCARFIKGAKKGST